MYTNYDIEDNSETCFSVGDIVLLNLSEMNTVIS